jgi:hypothetical protein
MRDALPTWAYLENPFAVASSAIKQITFRDNINSMIFILNALTCEPRLPVHDFFVFSIFSLSGVACAVDT